MPEPRFPGPGGGMTSIRAVIDCPRGGRVAMAGFPGLETGIDGSAYLDPESLHETVAELAELGAGTLLVLPEEGELPDGALDALGEAALAADLVPIFMPIRDFGTPGAAFMDRWATLLPSLRADLAAGRTVAACCQYGAGRSGMLAALLLIEEGTAPGHAIAQVRDHFDEAIESAEQEDWLRGRAKS